MGRWGRGRRTEGASGVGDRSGAWFAGAFPGVSDFLTRPASWPNGGDGPIPEWQIWSERARNLPFVPAWAVRPLSTQIRLSPSTQRRPGFFEKDRVPECRV
jgi:hypothetical protein